MIESFVKRPATTWMMVLVFVVLGIVSYFSLIVEDKPKIDLPLVSIKVVYPGASPADIEAQIIKKIEDVIAEISEIKKIESTANENYGFVMIEFNIEADVNIKAIEVKDKVESIINDFPKAAEKPEIAKYDPLIKPIMDMVLYSENIDDRTLYEYADKDLKARLTVIDGVASVDITGGKKRQINVDLDSTLMKKHFISINEVIGQISAKNLNIPGGSFERSSSNLGVRFTGEFESVAEIANMELVSKEGSTFKLSDIASVEDSFKKVETITNFNGTNSVGLSVKKLSDGDAVSIAKNVRKQLDNIIQGLPEGMNLVVATDTTEVILSNTYSTVWNIILGIILATIILFLFLGNVRVTLITVIVVPTSLISTFFLMDLSGFSINMVTLMAMAISVGTLIANALVIQENVSRHLEMKKSRFDSAVDGTKEVTVAVLASAGTNLVVFTPIAFMGEIVGQFMQQFGLTVVYATLFSILASFSVTPMLCALLLHPGKQEEYKIVVKINKFIDKVIAEYRLIFNFIMRHRWKTVIVCVIAMFSIVFPLAFTGSEFFGNSDMNIIRINVTAPQGTNIHKTRAIVSEIEQLVSDIPELDNYVSKVGVDGEENGDLTLNLIRSEKRSRTDKDIVDYLIPKIAQIPGAEINIITGEGQGPQDADVSINVYGEDYDKMIELSEKMLHIAENTGYFRSIESSYKNPKQEIRFTPDSQRLIFFDVKNTDVGSTIRNSINGNDTNIYKEKGEEYKLNVELSDEYKRTFMDVEQINIMASRGLIPISELGKVEYSESYPSIKRRDKKRVIQLSGYLSKSTAGQVQAILAEEFKKIEFPAGYGYKNVGRAEFFSDTLKEIAKAFIIAVILTYMLLVAIMNSFSLPFIIGTTILTSFIGVFYFLFFFGYSINIGSMMAIVMLVGIVVNNAILIVDHAMQRMTQDKLSPRDALWDGISVKFRAVFMISLSIIVGVVPQMFDKMSVKASMSGVMIGGLLGSILFTFILAPVVFDLIKGRKRKLAKNS
jgi:HAE1 family hydrophobic/amphiphilic exporter-1